MTQTRILYTLALAVGLLVACGNPGGNADGDNPMTMMDGGVINTPKPDMATQNQTCPATPCADGQECLNGSCMPKTMCMVDEQATVLMCGMPRMDPESLFTALIDWYSIRDAKGNGMVVEIVKYNDQSGAKLPSIVIDNTVTGTNDGRWACSGQNCWNCPSEGTCLRLDLDRADDPIKTFYIWKVDRSEPMKKLDPDVDVPLLTGRHI